MQRCNTPQRKYVPVHLVVLCPHCLPGTQSMMCCVTFLTRLSSSTWMIFKIFSQNMHEHQTHVCQVLQRLLENRQFVEEEKCEFHQGRVSVLGYITRQGELEVDPEKIRTVVDRPFPTTRKELQRFWGFSNFYRRFIHDYSKVAGPLNSLTSTLIQFNWTPEAQKAFLKLKAVFTSAPTNAKTIRCAS